MLFCFRQLFSRKNRKSLIINPLNIIMMFNFQQFIADTRMKEDKSVIIANYEKFYGSLEDLDIKQTAFYKYYLCKFLITEELVSLIKVPEELRDEFDWELLVRLVAASFSSQLELISNEDCSIDMKITVRSGENTVVKKLFELWSFQIARLYEIYIDEALSLFNLIKEEVKDAEAIHGQQFFRVERFNLMAEDVLVKIKQVRSVEQQLEGL